MVAQQQESNMRHMQETMQHAIEQPMEMAREYPVSSMLVVFGAGLGVGLLLSQVACAAMEEAQPPSFSDRMGKQIYDTVNHILPDAVRQQLHRFQH